MAYLVACFTAALSFLLNRAALRYVGLQAVITYSPAVEETTKTLLAFYLGADMLVTHVVFGTIEAVHDWATSQNHGTAAAVSSIFGHSLFGMVTMGALVLTGQILLALAAGIAVHLAWNIMIIRLTV
ncbi:MAG: hypothetical protein P4N59_00810 [Negativicutes bacterium]|nr:hypothetical protein [Negativicutes bacterium]